jgi:CspA family cold shock protein
LAPVRDALTLEFVTFKEIQVDGFKTLKEGQRVSFIAKQGQKGMQAEEVKVI